MNDRQLPLQPAPYDQGDEPRSPFNRARALKAANVQLRRQIVVLERRLAAAEERLATERGSYLRGLTEAGDRRW